MSRKPTSGNERIRYVATAESLSFSKKVAEHLDLDFDAAVSAADAPFLLTAYYHDIITALGQPYSEIKFADFSRRRLEARAAQTASGKAYVQVDQHFDFWTFGLCLLWSHAALNGVATSEEARFDETWCALLDQGEPGFAHEDVRKRIAHYLNRSGEAIRVAHDLSIACFSAVVCHELSHHISGHLGKEASHEIELDADRAGHQLMRKLYRPQAQFKLIPRHAYSLAGTWVLLKLIDASERRAAQRANLTTRRISETHPTAPVRLAALAPLFHEDLQSIHGWASFREGFELPFDAILQANQLDIIK